MKQEDKQIILIDLCSRLPYGIKVWYKYGLWDSGKFATSLRLADEKIALSHKFNKEGDWYPIEEANELLIKPYLRPMSSMTEEERKEYAKLLFADLGGVYEDYYKSLDYLHSIHVDYRGLIEKGLALEAPDGMYNNKEEQQ